MGYTAKDESSFNKNKVTINRYDNLISEYNNVIKNFNGINLIIDNPTATGYPYQNEKQSSTSIAKKYRDKKYLSFKGIDYHESEKTFNVNGKYTFTIQKGFYEITMLSAGAGGFATFGNKRGKYAQYPGCSGSMYKFIIYAQSSGTMEVTIGKGGPKFIRNDAYTGKWHREQPNVDGGDTTVKFNGNLVANCRGGGRLQYVFRTHGEHDCDIEATGIFNPEHVNQLGSYIVKLEQFKDNVHNIGNVDYYDKGQIRDTGWNYFGVNEEKNGAGGRAWSNGNNAEDIGKYTKDGKDGYFEIKSVNSKFGFLTEGIDLESRYIHTLGNENNIRRAYKNALEKIYNKLSSSTSLTQDTCSIIGTTTNETTSAKKYSEIKNIIEKSDKSSIEIDPSAFLLEVKTKYNDNMIFPEDDYILTYDINTLRKLKLETLNDTKTGIIEHGVISGYSGYKNNDDIIYIKTSDVGKTGNINVYKYINGKMVKQSSQAYFDTTAGTIKEYTKTGTYTEEITKKGNYRIICIGAGGGGAAAYCRGQGGGAGAGGGSGSGFDAVLNLNAGNYSITVGKGGTSKVKNTGIRRDKTLAGTNGGSSKFGSCIGYGGTAGSGGGTVVGTGGNTPVISYTIVSTSFNKKGNNGKKHTNQYYGNGVGGDAIYKSYGKGGTSKATKDNGTSTENGGNGYVSIQSVGTGKLIYNNKEYNEYQPVFEYGGIKWTDYEYDLQKLNRLKEYVATKNSWFDSEGYCQRSCQINCQTTVQKS